MEIVKGKVSKSFWNGKKVFLTGHTGFKGSWLSIWLQLMGSSVKGYSKDINTNPSLFDLADVSRGMESEIGDIRDLNQLKKSMTKFNPDILIHMAAQPLVRLSYKDPIETYSTNVMGTANVLESAKNCSNLKAVISVTTDKCYENKEWIWGYRETDHLGGHDPYSSSKGCAELVTSSYRRSFFYSKDSPSIASARAGNVIGGGDWAAERLLPDTLRAFEKSQPVIIRNPLSTRPWQHVMEPLSGYLVLAQELYENGDEFSGAWNFGPKDEDCKSVSWLLDNLVNMWGNNASWQLDDKNINPHESVFLKLDCSKANSKLKWSPKWSLKHSLNLVVDWHKIYMKKGNVRKECEQQIINYNNTK